ncbi:MAG TPA: carboxypeptidase-like regulatory domain-containing protein, partial [Candidatus Acidoferrales bacterium]|nr:carboxypeptidase-like regulatory domain-containing protein [Candidatus Acidoferrales bacterium]
MFVSSKNSVRVSVIFATLLAAIALMIAPMAAWGQAMVSGSIGGLVTDPTGAVVPGATVTITDTATKATQTVTSNKTGHFLFPTLKPGTYDVSITKAGFETLRIAAVPVTVSKASTLNETLQVGAASQTVEVTSNATAELQTMNSTMGETLSNNLMNLPAMNHDVASLLNYSATAAPSFHGTYGDVTSGSVAGSTPDQNTFV